MVDIKPLNGRYFNNGDFKDWSNSMSELFQDSGEEKNIRDVTFVLTEECNLRCTYCYLVHKNGKRMSEQVMKEAVDYILDKDRMKDLWKDYPKGLIVDLMGGEPTLEIDMIGKLIPYYLEQALLRDNHLYYSTRFSFNTNGTTYFEPKVQDLLDKYGNMLSLNITIDGKKELHDSCRLFKDGSGSHEIVERAVKDAIANRGLYTTKVTFSADNLDYMVDSLKYIWELGIPNISANPIFEYAWTTDEAYRYYNYLVELADFLLADNNCYKYYTNLFSDSCGTLSASDMNWCGGTGAMLSIGTDGTLYPCTRYMAYSLSTPGRKPLVIGNIKDGINQKEVLEDLCNITLSSQSEDKCLTCPINSGCALCSAWNYDLYGTANKRCTRICNMHKARVMANCYYWNKLYKKFDEPMHFDLNIPDEWALEIIDIDTLNYLKTL